MISIFQDVIIDRMEGSEVHRIELPFRQAHKPAFHLIGSRPCKRNNQNGVRLHSAFLDQTADALRDRVRLPGAGACQDKHGSVPVGDRFRLPGIRSGGRSRFLLPGICPRGCSRFLLPGNSPGCCARFRGKSRLRKTLIIFQKISQPCFPAASRSLSGCVRGIPPFRESP